jgi:hypothetical protein
VTRCRCWKCRRKLPIRLLAPRLAAAYDLQLEVEREKRRQRFARYQAATSRLLRERRVLEHRQLQLLRAGATLRLGASQKAYVKERDKKLAQARRRVRRAEEQVEALRAAL